MPELPEIEIVGRNLIRWAVGRRVEAVESLRATAFKDDSLEKAMQIVGERITSISRRGKVLWLETSGPVGWLMRFGMTGKWVQQVEEQLPQHTRARLVLDEGPPLCFVDMRNFGGIWGMDRALGPATLEAWIRGRDPMLEGLTGEALERVFSGRRVPVKALLLDQSVVAGVGNIYASESLYRAGIHPQRLAAEIDAAGCARLAQSITEVLTWAIEAEMRDEVRYFGEEGAENVFIVYQRSGEACPRCNTRIERVVLAGRSTFFCPGCQPG